MNEALRAMTASPLPAVRIAANGDAVALLCVQPLPPIKKYARNVREYAGRRIDLDCAADPEPPPYGSISLIQPNTGAVSKAQLPHNRGLWPLGFAPQGDRFAVAVVFHRSVALAIVTHDGTRAAPFREFSLNARTLPLHSKQPACRWFSDGERLLCRAVPAVRRSVRRGCTEAAFLDAFYRSDLLVVSARTGEARRIGITDVIVDARPSPDGRYVLVSTIQTTPVPLAEKTPSRLSFTNAVFDGSTIAGDARLVYRPGLGRCAQWAPEFGARLVWIDEANRLLCCDAPFGHDVIALGALPGLCERLQWTTAGRAVIWCRVGESRSAQPHFVTLTRNTAGHVVPLGASDALLTVDGLTGAEVLERGGAVYVTHEDGTLARRTAQLFGVEIATGQRRTLLAGDSDEYEICVGLMATGMSFLTHREGARRRPHFTLLQARTGRRIRITSSRDPHPFLTSCERRLMMYTRQDGVPLSAVLHLPFLPGQALESVPVLMWLYPSSASVVDHNRTSCRGLNQFRSVIGASPLLLLYSGYAVFVNYAFPLVPNGSATMDTFVEQMVMNVHATVRALADIGVADIGRLAVGGHSYGAFLAATLLAHTDHFRAGIVRSGVYNRAATPFGYQNEPRPYWCAPETYTRVSPLSVVHKISAPMLFLHGAWDDNAATTPAQSRDMYEALRRVGTPARYVELPYENHGRGPRESAELMMLEMVRWCDRYLGPSRTHEGNTR